MKRQIVISLSILFILFAIGSLVAILNIQKTTSHFAHLINIHQVEDLRHGLILKVLKVQSDLYTVNTPLGQNLGEIVNNVSSLDEAASNCTDCHHREPIVKELKGLQMQVANFKDALSFYITASANLDRIEHLKSAAAVIGTELLNKTERMSVIATQKSKLLTGFALKEIARAKNILFGALILALLLGIVLAINLTRSITRPISDLVEATRQITVGNLGHSLTNDYQAEYKELAENFNAMSSSLEEGHKNVLREIAERQQTEDALRQSEERYALASRGANDGLWDWDLKTNLIYFSPRWKTMLGYAEESIGNNPREWFDRVHPEDRGKLQAQIAAHLEGQTEHFESEYRLRNKHGDYCWFCNRAIAVRESSHAPHRMVGSQSDVTEQKLAEEQLKHDAFHDTLTGLPNRALFMDRLQQTVNAAQRNEDYLFAVLFLDLDRFKIINDSLGHFVGDQVLITIGTRLAKLLRPGDTVARLGGDEFAILLAGIDDGEAAIHIAQRIQSKLPEPLRVAEQEVFSTASIGIVISSAEYQDPDRIVRNADLAMYQAKANGKARYEIFDTVMHEATIRHMQMENDLHRALQRNEFLLHYQPIFSLTENRITGVEALIRWQHPTKGLVYPDDFIHIAEESGMIAEIGNWVLREACSMVKSWQQLTFAPLLTINLNLSSKEFTPGLLHQTKQILEDSGIKPSILRLEITETTIMDNPDSSIALLKELKALGVGLQIDDFGTGYSSLSYLHQFPIDALKIDRSFVMRMIQEPENLEIVKTIIDLAHNLKMDVIAEGVESHQELAMLRSLKCEYVQGYFISRPVAAEELEPLLCSGLQFSM